MKKLLIAEEDNLLKVYVKDNQGIWTSYNLNAHGQLRVFLMDNFEVKEYKTIKELDIVANSRNDEYIDSNK